ncbi:MAG: hypothetical protein IV093_04285 [Rubrivivax sp.]|nr:hypothetical protein [Rubrivivax sp.]
MSACLNRHEPDAESLRVLILSTPKTGNTWLRWLLYYAYDLPIINLPAVWQQPADGELPRRFVSHQHFSPSEDLLRWLVAERVTVLTTVRHPGDTFLSLFHYVKWRHDTRDELVQRLRTDGNDPGPRALDFLHRPFPQIYALSRFWGELGAQVVRFEDLLADPRGTLHSLGARLGQLDDERIRAAALLCKPDLMKEVSDIDPRHLRSSGAGGWVDGLPKAHRDILSTLPVYRELADWQGYEWDPAKVPSPYDYDKIDPFRGRYQFDNGERVTPGLVRIYLQGAPDAAARWPDPTRTGGDSFWNWLHEPCEASVDVPEFPPDTLNHLMACVHRIRPDLQKAYPRPDTTDRLPYAQWFLGQAHTEFGVPWSLMRRLQSSFASCLSERAVLPGSKTELQESN